LHSFISSNKQFYDVTKFKNINKIKILLKNLLLLRINTINIKANILFILKYTSFEFYLIIIYYFSFFINKLSLLILSFTKFKNFIYIYFSA
jgi:hypothetical protein